MLKKIFSLFFGRKKKNFFSPKLFFTTPKTAEKLPKHHKKLFSNVFSKLAAFEKIKKNFSFFFLGGKIFKKKLQDTNWWIRRNMRHDGKQQLIENDVSGASFPKSRAARIPVDRVCVYLKSSLSKRSPYIN